MDYSSCVKFDFLRLPDFIFLTHFFLTYLSYSVSIFCMHTVYSITYVAVAALHFSVMSDNYRVPASQQVMKQNFFH